MNEKQDQIKKLQEELFVEEYGVTKEQARKLNEFIFHEPTGEEFNGFLGYKTISPSVFRRFSEVAKESDKQSKRMSELEWEHKKLWMGTWAYIIVSSAIFIFILAVIE